MNEEQDAQTVLRAEMNLISLVKQMVSTAPKREK